ncbi:MAG: hypothetical protein PHU08_00125 [Dehalococcoidales bacterium]|nr:hypothetical protein [Dehalococcoidales bacterium]
MFKLISDEQQKKIASRYIGKEGAAKGGAKAQLASCEKEFAEKVEAELTELREFKRRFTDPSLRDSARKASDEYVEAIKREARKELFDFMNTNCEHFHPDHQWQSCPCQPCYEAKLKEWGLDS